MRTTLASLCLTVLLASAGPAHALDVTYAARVDEQGLVFIDVSNETKARIVVTTFALRFFGAHDKILAKTTSDCEDDCTVAPGATEAFGPFAAPEDWETVQVDEVFYDAAAAVDRASARKTPGAYPSAPPTPRPTARPQTAAPAGPAASPETALRELYRWLVRGDHERARQMYTTSGRESAVALGEAGFDAWAQKETKQQTVVDVRLLEPFEEAPAGVRVEIDYADGSKALRRVQFRQEDGGWRVERIEEAR